MKWIKKGRKHTYTTDISSATITDSACTGMYLVIVSHIGSLNVAKYTKLSSAKRGAERMLKQYKKVYK